MAGTTFTWTATTASAWTIPGNWSPVGTPVAGDIAIDPAGTIQVNSGTVAAADLSIGGSLAAPLPGKGAISATAGGDILISDALAVWSGSTLSVDANSSVDIGPAAIAVAGNVDIESGHTLQGDGLVQASVVNNGAIDVLGTVASNVFTPGTLEITGNLTGSGDVVLTGMNAIVQFDGSVATTQTIDFGTGSELILSAPGSGFAVPITNLNTGDKIEFAGLQAKSASVTSPGTITVITNTGSYLLTNVSFAAGASQQLFTGTDGTNGDGYIQVAPPFSNWVGGSGDIGVTGNWQGGVAPDSIRSASFFNNPGTLTGSATALSLNIGGTGTWTFNGATITVAGQPSPPFLPFGTGFGTNVVITNATTLTESGATSIGATTSSSVTASGGSQVTTEGDTIGNSAGQSGTLIVTGAGTTWREQGAPINGNYPGFLTVGNSGVGSLIVNGGGNIDVGTDISVGNNAGGVGSATIGSGGTVSIAGVFSSHVGNNAGSSGSLTITAGGVLRWTAPGQTNQPVLRFGNNGPTGNLPGSTGTGLVTGPGALIDTNGNPLAIGNTGATGDLTIANGGSVVVGTPDSSLEYALALANNGGTGSLTITDPGSNLTANGYVLLGRGGDASLTIENNASLVVNDAPLNGNGVGIGAGRSAGPGTTGQVGGNGVAVVTSGGVLQNNSTLNGVTVGGNGVNGALNVSNNGTVLAGIGLTVGTATSAGGTIYGGSGSLNIGAGGVVRVNHPTLKDYDIIVGNANSSIGGPTGAASGQAVVSGAGALLDANGAGIAVGWQSSGDLTISQGASVVSGTPDDSLFAALSIGRQSSGNVTVTDTGSTYSANGSAYVGRAGAGDLTVQNHGSLTVGVDGLGNGGLSIGGGGLASGSTLYVGGSGTGLVDTNGDIFSQQNVDVGRNGTDGVLTIDAGGTVEAGQQVLLGQSITLTAGDTIINATGTTAVTAPTLESATGNIDVGPGGILKVDATGISSSTPSIVLGDGAGASGDLNVSGAGALVNNTGSIQIGGAGVGTLSIQSGGTVTGLAGADIAALAGSDGSSVSVNGAGSDWQTGGALQVGGAAAGSLSITAGGAVSATTLDLSPTATGAGGVSVIGAGSALTLSGALTIGDASAADMVIGNGATVSAASADLGAQAAGTGNLDVEGAGSQLLTAGKLIIGDQGHAQLTIGAGATVHATGGFLVGLGGVVTQFGGVLDPPGPSINQGSIGGTGQTVGDVENDGTIFAKGGTYEVTGNITTGIGQAGSLIVDSLSSDLVLDQSVDSGQSAFFTASSGTLTIEQPGNFAATIFSFKTGDTVQAVGATGGTFDTKTDVLTLNTGATLQFFGKYTDPTLWQVSANGVVTLSAPCFMAGTRISTERGEVAVEQLSVGDRVQVVLGGQAEPVVWIGHRTVDCTHHPEPHKVWPVRIAAHAFGANRPCRELFLSPDHAVYVDGVLIPVKLLINGSDIERAPRDTVTYYHVELPRHSVLLAEGLATESYLDTGDRANFVNGDGPIALYPDFASRVWDAEGCAPLVVTGPQLEAARRWVNGLAGRVAA